MKDSHFLSYSRLEDQPKRPLPVQGRGSMNSVLNNFDEILHSVVTEPSLRRRIEGDNAGKQLLEQFKREIKNGSLVEARIKGKNLLLTKPGVIVLFSFRLRSLFVLFPNSSFLARSKWMLCLQGLFRTF